LGEKEMRVAARLFFRGVDEEVFWRIRARYYLLLH
jgi:hypothetical protein